MRVLLALAFAAPLLAQEPVAVNSKVVKVEFENDRIRVLRVHYGPHEKRDMKDIQRRSLLLSPEAIFA
jgi:hypothetical protein